MRRKDLLGLYDLSRREIELTRYGPAYERRNIA